MALDYKVLGLRIKMARLQRRLTQEKVAEVVGISLSHMSNVETANTKVSLHTLIGIANAIGCTIDELLQDNLKYPERVFDAELNEIIQDCDVGELKVIADTARVLKSSIRQRIKNSGYTVAEATL